MLPKEAIVALEKLLETGAFLSHVAESSRWPVAVDRFSNRNLSRRSMTEAAFQLSKYRSESLRSAFAASIEPVVRGIVTLANARPRSVVNLTNCAGRMNSTIDVQFGPRHKVAVFNYEFPDTEASTGSGVWGPRGKLGLSAVILEVGFSEQGQEAELSLVLPPWGRVDRPPSPGDCVILRFDLAGLCRAKQYKPRVEADQGDQPFTDAGALLGHLLGMASLDRSLKGVVVDSDLDTVVGFPGAGAYLAETLPTLGDYLTGIAKEELS